MTKNTDKRDYQYVIRLKGAQLMKGDAQSIGVIFGHFDGRNFNSRTIKNQTYSEWLDYMAAYLKTPLENGARIEMLNPEGALLEESSIGNSIDADGSEATELKMKNSPDSELRAAVMSQLIKGGYFPLTGGDWVKIGGNGTGYWVAKYCDSNGIEHGISGGHVYPKDAAAACIDLNSERLDFDRYARLNVVEKYPDWVEQELGPKPPRMRM